MFETFRLHAGVLVVLAVTGQACGESNCTDHCASGTTTCQGEQLFTCGDYNSDGCSEWGNVQNCPAGCQVDHCVLGCTNLCRQGTRRCSGTGAYETCGDYNSDGCTEWGGLQSCPDNNFCNDAATCEPCPENCTELGQRQCSGANGFQQCERIDGSECLRWGQVIPCGGDQTCLHGVCEEQCQDECVLEERRCLGEGYQVCGRHDQDPCTEWGPVTECKESQTCSGAGICSDVCKDDCLAGQSRCSGYTAVLQCGQFDHDTCQDWSAPRECLDGKRCLEEGNTASCVSDCQQECSTIGAKQCSGDGWQECGEFDQDTCREWGPVQRCGDGMTCSGEGVCTTAASCTQDCTAGQRMCANDTAYRDCGQSDTDSCLDWGPVTSCGPNKRCQGAGECVDSCVQPCTADSSGCVDGDTRWFCADSNGDGCLEQRAFDCPDGWKCDAGTCEAGGCTGDDDLEPNDSHQQARAITESHFYRENLYTCGGHDDWYRITVGIGEGLKASIEFDNGEGDLDLELYDIADATMAVDLSTWSGQDVETVVALGQDQAKTYLIKVYSYVGDSNHYTLRVDRFDPNDCVDDYLEKSGDNLENDDPATATEVGNGIYHRLVLCMDDGDPDNVDQYLIWRQTGENLAIWVWPENQETLDVTVYDANGYQLAVVTQDAYGGYGYELSNPPDVKYSVRISRPRQAMDHDIYYTLHVSPASLNCPDDGYEPNDQTSQATLLTPQDGMVSINDLMLCSGDLDMFRVDVPTGSDMQVEVSFASSICDLDLYLWDSDLNLIDYSLGSGDVELLDTGFSLDGSPGGTFFIDVEGYTEDDQCQYELGLVMF